jgi:hypothetical protein
MTTEPMWADNGASLWRLPRVQLSGGSSQAHIESKIALAAFKGILANPDGSGRKYRRAHGDSEAFGPPVTVAKLGY